MSLRLAALFILVAGLGIVAYGTWYHWRHPRQIVSTGTVRVESRLRPGPALTLKTRVFMVGAIRLEEVEMPGGTWIDCAGDCRRAALDAGPEFWDAQARDRGR